MTQKVRGEKNWARIHGFQFIDFAYTRDFGSIDVVCSSLMDSIERRYAHTHSITQIFNVKHFDEFQNMNILMFDGYSFLFYQHTKHFQ